MRAFLCLQVVVVAAFAALAGSAWGQDSDSPPAPVLAPDLESPPTPTGLPVASDPPPAPPRPVPAIVIAPPWIERPTAEHFAAYYPERALVRDVGGRVVLDCIVQADGRLECSVSSEDPPGWGFGEAAMLVSRHFRMATETEDGRPTEAGRVRVPIRFAPPRPERPAR